MSKTFTSWGALKSALQKELYSAMEEMIDKSLEDARSNVGEFYNSPGGTYQRTGQLASSPESSFSGGGDSAMGEISLNTSEQYNPSGRDVLTIYNYANAGGLLGNGGFWEKTIADVDKNIQDAFGKRFK